LVGGVADIQSNTIRTVGRAQERFDEDPLRKLRALRFAGRTGSKLEKNTAEAIISDNSLEDISSERIRDEFKKSVESAKSAKFYLNMVSEFSLWGVMFPGLEVNKTFLDTNNWLLQITQLFGDNQEELLKKELNKLSFSNQEIDTIIFFKRFLELKPETAFQLSKEWKITKLDKKLLLEFSKINKLDLKLVKAFLKYKPSTNGGQVMKEFGLRGSEIGDKIKEIETEKFKKLV